MSPAAEVRAREDSDLPALIDLLHAVHEYDGFPPRWPLDPTAWLTPDLQLAAWTARRADSISVEGHVGLTLVAPGRDTTQVWEQATARGASALRCVRAPFVSPAARGSGLGRLLLAAATTRAEEEGCRAVLEVAATDRAAVLLYEALGWHYVGSLAGRAYLPPGVTSLLYTAPEVP